MEYPPHPPLEGLQPGYTSPNQATISDWALEVGPCLSSGLTGEGMALESRRHVRRSRRKSSNGKSRSAFRKVNANVNGYFRRQCRFPW